MEYKWDMNLLRQDRYLYNIIKEQDRHSREYAHESLKPYQRLLNNFYSLEKYNFLQKHCIETEDFFIKKMKGSTEIPHFESPIY